jgi:hypothetical protein
MVYLPTEFFFLVFSDQAGESPINEDDESLVGYHVVVSEDAVTEEDNIGNGGRISLYTEERWYLSMVTVLLGFLLHKLRSCSSANGYESN